MIETDCRASHLQITATSSLFAGLRIVLYNASLLLENSKEWDTNNINNDVKSILCFH